MIFWRVRNIAFRALSTEQYLKEFDWCWSLDTAVSMGIRRPAHFQERDQVLLLWGPKPCFPLVPSDVSGGSGSGYLNHATPRDCLSSVENMAERAQSRLDEILTEDA
jgi:hypothetical protein